MRYVDRAAFSKRHAKEIEAIRRSVKGRYRRIIGRASLFVAQVRPPLMRLFESKCAYCETQLDAGNPGGVDQYRPKREYPWLAYE